MNELKNALRQEKLAALKTINNRENRENRATDAVLSYIENHGFEKIAIYVSVRDELSTREIVNRLLSLDKRVFVPVCVSESEMVFTEINREIEWINGKYGIPEPKIRTPETDFDAVIVPLVAFDGNKNRLGKGKGYYDRFLSDNKARKIGVAFREQKAEFVPTEKTDVKLDEVLVF
mgnify:FL=1